MNRMPQAILILACAGGAYGGTIYSVADLGTLGGSASQAYGLNDCGQAAGMATTRNGSMQAVLYSGSGALDLASAGEAEASGIDNAGQVSGTQYIGGKAYATVWTGGTATVLAGSGSYAMAIDQSGDIAGMFVNSSGAGDPFLTGGGVFEDLGAVPGSQWGAAYAIGDSGEAAGYAQIGGAMRAFAWSPGAGYAVLGTLGGANSYAMAINDAGEVAGHAQVASGYLHAFLWCGGVMLDLGTLGGNSYAYGVNGAGEVVGYSYLADGEARAFVYENGRMVDLNSLIGAGSGWTLSEAYAINASGEIAGTGMFNGVEHAFLLDPVSPAAVPEPGAGLLVMTGLAGLAGFRIARRKLPLLRLRRARLRELPESIRARGARAPGGRAPRRRG